MVQRVYTMLPCFSTNYQENNSNNNDSTNKIRVGIIGASSIAKHAIIWPSSKNPNIVITSIAARDQSNAQKYASKHNIPIVHSSYQSLLQDPNIDAVYIGIITELHYKIAIQALEHHKHVLIEKPGVLSYLEGMELVNKAKENKVVLFEAFHWRFHPAAKRVWEIIHNDSTNSTSSEIGDIQSIEAFSGMFDPKSYFNPLKGERGRVKLLDRWCYLVDELHYFLNRNDVINDEDYKIDIENVSLSMNRIQAIMKASLLSTNKNTDQITTDNSNNNVRYEDTKTMANTQKTIKHDQNAKQAILIHFDAYKDKIEIPKWYITIKGTNGSITYNNIIFPFIYHSIQVTNYKTTTTRVEKVFFDPEQDHASRRIERDGRRKQRVTTFDYQLDEFIKAIHECDYDSEQSCSIDSIRNNAMDQLLRNVRLYERLIAFTGQSPLESW